MTGYRDSGRVECMCDPKGRRGPSRGVSAAKPLESMMMKSEPRQGRKYRQGLRLVLRPELAQGRRFSMRDRQPDTGLPIP